MPLDVDGLAVEYGTFMGQSTRCIALGASLLPGSVKTEAGEKQLLRFLNPLTRS